MGTCFPFFQCSVILSSFWIGSSPPLFFQVCPLMMVPKLRSPFFLERPVVCFPFFSLGLFSMNMNSLFFFFPPAPSSVQSTGGAPPPHVNCTFHFFFSNLRQGDFWECTSFFFPFFLGPFRPSKKIISLSLPIFAKRGKTARFFSFFFFLWRIRKTAGFLS